MHGCVQYRNVWKRFASTSTKRLQTVSILNAAQILWPNLWWFIAATKCVLSVLSGHWSCSKIGPKEALKLILARASKVNAVNQDVYQTSTTRRTTTSHDRSLSLPGICLGAGFVLECRICLSRFHGLKFVNKAAKPVYWLQFAGEWHAVITWQ